jgi:hypothetical protein
MDFVEDVYGTHLKAEFLWHPPQFNTSEPPSLAAKLELEQDPSFSENFVRTIKWYVKKVHGS